MPTMSDDFAYHVVETAGRFEIQTRTGRTVMVIRDRGSADQYSLMLNDAYRAGYRQALRDNRKQSE